MAAVGSIERRHKAADITHDKQLPPVHQVPELFSQPRKVAGVEAPQAMDDVIGQRWLSISVQPRLPSSRGRDSTGQ
jgi:hypothetical protein